MAKLLIVGGGISGLAAGVLAAKNGFQVEVYEKNAQPGGLCAQWTRRGFRLDTGPRWLSGAAPGGEMRPLWQAVGALGEEMGPGEAQPVLAFSLGQGQTTLPLLRCPEDLEEAMLHLSPQDGPEIGELCRLLRRTRQLSFPQEKPLDMMMAWEKVRLGAHLTARGRLLPAPFTILCSRPCWKKRPRRGLRLPLPFCGWGKPSIPTGCTCPREPCWPSEWPPLWRPMGASSSPARE